MKQTILVVLASVFLGACSPAPTRDLSITEKKAFDIVKMMKYAYDRLPDWLKEEVTILNMMSYLMMMRSLNSRSDNSVEPENFKAMESFLRINEWMYSDPEDEIIAVSNKRSGKRKSRKRARKSI